MAFSATRFFLPFSGWTPVVSCFCQGDEGCCGSHGQRGVRFSFTTNLRAVAVAVCL